MFWSPSPKNVTSVHSKLLLDKCKFDIVKDERPMWKMEDKTNFSRYLRQFDGLTWLTLIPVILRPLNATECDSVAESGAFSRYSGCVVEFRTCNREVAGLNLDRGYFTPRLPYSAFHPYGVGKWVLAAAAWEGKGRYGSFRLRMKRTVQGKLWYPLTMRAIYLNERLIRDVTNRHYLYLYLDGGVRCPHASIFI